MEMTSLIDAGIGGSVVAVINYVLTYHKTQKLEDKINNNLESRLNKLEDNQISKNERAQMNSQFAKLFEKVDNVSTSLAKIEGKLEAKGEKK